MWCIGVSRHFCFDDGTLLQYYGRLACRLTKRLTLALACWLVIIWWSLSHFLWLCNCFPFQLLRLCSRRMQSNDVLNERKNCSCSPIVGRTPQSTMCCRSHTIGSSGIIRLCFILWKYNNALNECVGVCLYNGRTWLYDDATVATIITPTKCRRNCRKVWGLVVQYFLKEFPLLSRVARVF